jgi:hypothetical protein
MIWHEAVTADGKTHLPANRIECFGQHFEFIVVERANASLEVARDEEKS